MATIIYIGNMLSRHGWNQTSIETLGPALEREGYKIWYASSKKNRLLRLMEMIWVVLTKSKSSDFVMIDTYSTQNFWYAWIISQLCRIIKIPYIAKLHGGDLPNRIKSSPKASRQIFSNALLNIAPSGYLMDAFSKAGFPNLKYIPNTIELENYEFKERSEIQPRLLWVRSFADIYNPEMAVHVAGKLKEKFSSISLCMVGADKGNYFDKLTELARSFDIDIRLTGKLSKSEWANLSKDYDIFINTTHFDNTPVSVIEAMALGLPVVSTNVGGIPFLITSGETGLLVEDSNVDQMCDAIENLMLNPSLVKQLSQNANKMVREFDFERVKSLWFEILK